MSTLILSLKKIPYIKSLTPNIIKKAKRYLFINYPASHIIRKTALSAGSATSLHQRISIRYFSY